MTESILIQGGHVVDPANSLDQPADVLLEGGKVAAVGKVKADADRVINARGLLVLPGLVDLRTHVGEPGRDSEETIAHAAEVAVHGGFTTIACMPDTDPALDNVAAALYVKRQSERAGYAEVVPVCALTRGRAGRELSEIGQLVEAGAVAFSDEQRAENSPAAILRGMQYASMFDRAVIEYAQDPELAGGAMNAGKECSLAGLPGISPVAEELAISRACMFAREAGAHYHAALLTTRNGMRAVKRARKLKVRVTAEVAAHHLCFADEVVRRRYDTNFKVFPPLRTHDDIKWLKRGLAEGFIDCIVSGHRAVPPQEKELEFGNATFGAVGLETALAAAWEQLVIGNVLSRADFVAKLTINPARILRLQGRKGALAPGHDADVCLFDPNAKINVTPASLHSRTKNSPFMGATLTGRVVATVARGRVFEF
ncbi:MAG: dihydroorotase [Planctomycetes bacterium]|nr:dihydroorotase [Planctomycetota bacterium]MCW8135128.1 dihydroorotase [Planctomycetota bacterium]